MYHRVATAEADPLELCVAPERFREQLELLGSLGEIVPLETLVRDRRGHGLKVAADVRRRLRRQRTGGGSVAGG